MTKEIVEKESKIVSMKWFVEDSNEIRRLNSSTKETACRMFLENFHAKGALLIASKPQWKKVGLTQEKMLELYEGTTHDSRTALFQAMRFATEHPDLSLYFKNENNPISITGWRKMISIEAKKNKEDEAEPEAKEEKKGYETCGACGGKGYVARS